MKKVLLFSGTLLIAFAVGAATGTKITAELQIKSISYNGKLSSQKVVAYKGSTYVPVKEFSALLNIPLEVKNGVIYLDGNNTVTAPAKQQKYTISVDGVKKGTSYDDQNAVMVDVTLGNNSGESQSFISSNYIVRAYQNGVEIDNTIINDTTTQEIGTSILSGNKLTYGCAFVLKDDSPITVEVSDVTGAKIINKTFKLD